MFVDDSERLSESASGPHVLVLGVGFAGLQVVLGLADRIDTLPEGTQVTAVDRSDRHTFTPLLYEVASAAVEQGSDELLRAVIDGASIPYTTLFDRMPEEVSFLQGSIEAIDTDSKKVALADGTVLPYDILVFALGSTSEYFGLPGVEEFGMKLKTIDDALAIRSKLYQLVKTCCHGATARVVVAGGGPTGVEFSAEVRSLLQMFEKKGVLKEGLVEVHLIHAGEVVLDKFHPSTSRKAMKRLQGTGVHLHLGRRVEGITETVATLDDGSKHPFDVFVWAGGIRGQMIAKEMEGSTLTKRGTMEVSADFRVTGLSDVFAAGDAVQFLHPDTEVPVPAIAQAAQKQGELLAKNIALSLLEKPLELYDPPETWPTAVPLYGSYSLIELKHVRLSGRLGYVVRLLADLRYFMTVLPFWEALKHWGRGTRSYVKNDA